MSIEKMLRFWMFIFGLFVLQEMRLTVRRISQVTLGAYAPAAPVCENCHAIRGTYPLPTTEKPAQAGFVGMPPLVTKRAGGLDGQRTVV